MTAASALAWRDAAEKGTVAGIQVLAWAAGFLGRRATRWLLFPVAAWYVAFHPSVRRGSRAYLRRLRGRARLADVYRHVLCFARVTLDRLFMVQGDFRPFDVSSDGAEHLAALRDGRRGAIRWSRTSAASRSCAPWRRSRRCRSPCSATSATRG